MMLGPAVAGMISAALKTCVEAQYDDIAEMGQSGCDKEGYLEKRHPPPPIAVLDSETGERSLVRRIGAGDLPGDLEGGPADMTCHYSSNMCTGPRIFRKFCAC